jgi:hypothetical protein
LAFRTASQNHIAVELFPGVPAYMKWPVSQSTEPVMTQSRGVPGTAHQGELQLRSSFLEPATGTRNFSPELQSAVRDLERAVERIKLIANEPRENAPGIAKGATNKRRRKP